MDKNLLTIKEFAKLANKTQQTIYKQLNNRLNQYIQLVDNKKMLEYRALKEVFNIGVEQPIQPELNNSFNPKKDVEIEFLRKQIEQLQKELEKEKITIYTYKADVSNREEARGLIEFAIEKFKKIDVLINNAGISQMKLFTDITDTEWNDMLNINLNSAFYCTQEATKHMLINKEGCIINISSIWGITGASCEVHYSTAKAALNGFTKALAKELVKQH